MLYVGVESDNAENLKLVKKRQEPGQVHKDLVRLNGLGFTIVAMTIIGLPYDTQDSIMRMADWITKISKYQTANFLTPLPATSNWTDLVPLDADGGILPEGKIRPYHLYTGRQFVHQDERWGMEESPTGVRRVPLQAEPDRRALRANIPAAPVFPLARDHLGQGAQRHRLRPHKRVQRGAAYPI